MIKIKDVIEVVENFAPLSLQESWDNCGVQVGYSLDRGCTGVVLTLDVTLAAVNMAVESGANLVIAHHPMTIGGVKSFTDSSEVGRIIHSAVQNNVAIYSAHTSLDSCAGGINDYLAELLGLKEVEVLVPTATDGVGLGRIGRLPKAITPGELAELVKSQYGAEAVRYCDGGAMIERVALCSGSGGSLLENALRANVDGYICSDLKYHSFTDMVAEGLTLVDVGHFESEIFAIDIFERIICEKFSTFAVLKCRTATVQYL